jgi:hypothetical protein
MTATHDCSDCYMEQLAVRNTRTGGCCPLADGSVGAHKALPTPANAVYARPPGFIHIDP